MPDDLVTAFETALEGRDSPEFPDGAGLGYVLAGRAAFCAPRGGSIAIYIQPLGGT